MSDIQNDQTVADAIDQGAPPEPAAGGEQDYKSLYEAEKAHRQRERNLYGKAQRLLSDLDDESVSAINALAEMVRRGDAEAITDWSLQTAQNVSGKDLAALIAARQNAPAGQPPVGQTAPEPTESAPLDPQQLEELVEKAAARQVAVASLASQIKAEMAEAGYTPTDPAGRVIVAYARENNVPIGEAIEWFEADAAARVAQRNQRLAAVAASVPTPAPAGTPAVTAPAPEMTPKEKAAARLRAGAMG